MKNKKKIGEKIEYEKDSHCCSSEHSRLRDYFARYVDVDRILQNLKNEQIEILMNKTLPHNIKAKIKYQAELHAKLRYLFADAMIMAREFKNQI